MLRPGDRVRLSMRGQLSTVQQGAVSALRAAGVDLVTQVLPERAAPRMSTSAQEPPAALFERFADLRGLGGEARALGLEILEEVAASPESGSEGIGMLLDTELDLGSRQRELILQRVEMEGYGPFRGRVEYRLDSGGIR